MAKLYLLGGGTDTLNYSWAEKWMDVPLGLRNYITSTARAKEELSTTNVHRLLKPK